MVNYRYASCAQNATLTVAMNSDADSAQSLIIYLSYTYSLVRDVFYKIPGSAVVARYVKSSHQNDPGRTLLELILFLFAVFTLLQSRTRADRAAKNFVKYTEEVSFFPDNQKTKTGY